MNIYVASSWRNPRQQEIVEKLREDGHQVYDYKNPEPPTTFHWSEIEDNYRGWSAENFRKALKSPLAHCGFNSDMDAMQKAEALILYLPCGRSAHLEAGWAAGKGKPLCILLDEEPEPELMYLLADCIAVNYGEVANWLDKLALHAGKQKKQAG